MTQPNSEQAFDQWCIVELFGHQRLAGRVSEQVIAGTSFVRVDVPECEGRPAFTTFKGGSAIYGITPVSEEIARAVAANIGARPVQSYELPKLAAQAEERDNDDAGY